MRCPRCGNDNPPPNRFCGTCGASLLSAPPPAARSENTAQATVARTSPGLANAAAVPATRTAPPVSERVPPISGPSLLGLGAPDSSRSGSDLNLQPDPHHGPPSRNLDYLLDDEEEHRGFGGKVILILIALVLATGFGYLRWRHQGLSSLWSSQPKPSAAQTAEAPQPSTDAPSNTADNTSSPAPNSPSEPAAAAPTSKQPTRGPSEPAAAAPDSSASVPSAATPAAVAAPPDTGSSAPADPGGAAAAPPAAASAPAPEKSEDKDSEAAPAPSAAEPASAPKPAAKPHSVPKPTVIKPFDQVTEAEKYIYGRSGVRQDCDRGMRMLRPAAEQSNPKAMISLGALYSTGVCAPKDLPTAYRWFAMALRRQPDNQPLEENLQRLWAQMTQPERQLAVKLSQ